MLDGIVGLAIITTLTVVLTVGVQRYRTGTMRMEHQRTAMRIAEKVMMDMGVDEPRIYQADDVTINVEPVLFQDAPSGRKWVNVQVTYRESTAELMGLVPLTAFIPK